MAGQPLAKSLVKRSALAAWVQAVYRAADAVCTRDGLYDNKSPTAGRQFMNVLKELESAVVRLQSLQASTQSQSMGSACDSDDGCPDGQICVDGNCESPYPLS